MRPELAPNIPAAQSKQLFALADALNFPRSQAVHVDVSTEYIPALQAEQKEAPIVVGLLPSGQSLQVSADDPTVLLYFPIAQSLQLWGEVAPATVEYLPAPQAMQAVALVAAVAVEYLPAAQGSHDVVGAAEGNFPAGHSAHAVALVAK